MPFKYYTHSYVKTFFWRLLTFFGGFTFEVLLDMSAEIGFAHSWGGLEKNLNFSRSYVQSYNKSYKWKISQLSYAALILQLFFFTFFNCFFFGVLWFLW